MLAGSKRFWAREEVLIEGISGLSRLPSIVLYGENLA
jgi:hypothetical protein